jgi:uncharacterized protein
MHIQLEAPDNNAIRSYTDSEITIGTTVYQQSVIISKDIIISRWPVRSVHEINEKNLAPLLKLEPEVIILGHQQSGVYIPAPIMQYLSKQRIGIECMSIGAASRTFNVLLSEQRSVIAAIILG